MWWKFGCLLFTPGIGAPIGEPVSARFWRPSGRDFEFPENVPGAIEHLSGREDFGIALAGGGFRGLALAQGAIRSLKDAGILDQAKYLSVSSGSVWLGVPLYFQTQDGIDAFLGKTLPPDQLTPEVLTEPESAGTLVDRLPDPFSRYPWGDGDNQTTKFSQALRRKLLQKVESHGGMGIPSVADLAECLEDLCLCLAKKILPEGNLLHELWADVTGEFLMRPFGLHAVNSTYCHASEQNRTQQLMGDGVTVYPSQDVEHKLPFLISQSAVYALGSGTNRETNPMTAFPKENTLMYTGVPLPYSGKDLKTEPYSGLGDLYVEPFASSSEALQALPRETKGEVKVRRHVGNYNLGQLVDWESSSTSIVSMVQVRPQYLNVAEKHKCFAGAALSSVMNEELIFSPLQRNWLTKIPKTHSLPIGDAGVYDDNGHLPLLRRGVTKMIIYDSWVHHDDEAAEMVYTKAAFGQTSVLYGGQNAPGAPNPYEPKGFLTVFEPAEFQALWDRVRELKAARKPIVVRQNVTVVDNKHFGIKGGWNVDIVFVIALPIDSFVDALPEETKALLPSYFPNMDSDELLAKFHLAAIAQYASHLTETSVVGQVHAMLRGDPLPPVPPSPPAPAPVPAPTPTPPAPTHRCLDQTTQEQCERTRQIERGICAWCHVGQVGVCMPQNDCSVNGTSIVV